MTEKSKELLTYILDAGFIDKDNRSFIRTAFEQIAQNEYAGGYRNGHREGYHEGTKYASMPESKEYLDPHADNNCGYGIHW